MSYSKPLKIYDAEAPWEPTYEEKLVYIREQLSLCRYLFGDDLYRGTMAYYKASSIFKLPYLRVFREEYSVSTFYACIEYLMMLVHALCLINAAHVEGSRTLAREIVGEVRGRLMIRKRDLSDGKILGTLKWICEGMMEKALPYEFLGRKVPTWHLEGLRRLLADLEIGYRVGNATRWLEVLESAVAIRNSTKGHGTLYFISNEHIRSAIRVVVDITTAMSEDERAIGTATGAWVGIHGMQTYRVICAQDIARLFGNGLVLMHDGRTLPLSPYILWHEGDGAYLFNGLSDDGSHVHYKNYSSGMHALVERSLTGLTECSNPW